MAFRNRASIDVLAIIVVFAILAVAYGTYFSQKMRAHSPTHTAATSTSTVTTITLKGTAIRVMLATTAAEREQGLSGKAGLAPDEGMLFVFDTDGEYAFWMKDMLFSIDMVWLSSEGKVVYIAKDVTPATYPASFAPSAPSRYVVELPAGWADAHGIQVGDQAGL